MREDGSGSPSSNCVDEPDACYDVMELLTMVMYTKQELEEAKTSLASTLSKCEKIQEGGKLQSSQKTLNDRRVRALRIALDLIEKETRKYDAD